jgi:hypothetical protein
MPPLKWQIGQGITLTDLLNRMDRARDLLFVALDFQQAVPEDNADGNQNSGGQGNG